MNKTGYESVIHCETKLCSAKAQRCRCHDSYSSMASQLATTLPLPSVTNEAFRRSTDGDEWPQGALTEVEVLTSRGGMVPVTVLLYDFCRELGESLVLSTKVEGEMTQTELDNDKS